MALKEIDEKSFPFKLISTEQKEDAFESAVKAGIKVVYTNQEIDGAFSSNLSNDDWNILTKSLAEPKYNEKLAALLKMESVFD